MFDSRTIKPVSAGTHRYGGATKRWFREMGKGETIAYGTPPARQLATRKAGREAIADGLADIEQEAEEAAAQYAADCEAIAEMAYAMEEMFWYPRSGCCSSCEDDEWEREQARIADEIEECYFVRSASV